MEKRIEELESRVVELEKQLTGCLRTVHNKLKYNAIFEGKINLQPT
ncbi:hypothetical protein Xvie_03943 [Xenorhabdus vietnamensis]|uniref:Uncharacterized protein n=1 Tax=Xenorhabdus vietnamensis TaxID=351656 RepID=A0A1Y2S6D6_9GAMM|nr:hypothetical protein [Xenorhabdus vietnamensis]OTA14165.1 hypothetical protein Xvie_03943 [Xenorhabdus vietnamensis]